jgi:hypothetical protein
MGKDSRSIKNKMRGRIDPDWEEANFGEEFNWDQARSMGTSNKINISDPKTAESFTEFAKQNDPEGFKKIEKIVDDINNKNTLENFDITGRKKNAKGGLNYLMGL